MTMTRARCVAAVSVLLGASALAGCGEGYVLRGRVIEAQTSYVALVDPSDPRLSSDEETGIPGVNLHLQLDPGKINRETIAREVSDTDGEFAIHVDKFGAGWMEYDVGLFAHRSGYTPAQHFFRLPPDSTRVLIMMAPGRDQELGEDRDMSMDDYDRFR